MEITARYDASCLGKSLGSKWIVMILFGIGPNLVSINQGQTALIRPLEKQGIEANRLKLLHTKLLGGGYHCITRDIRRSGTLQRYFN